MEILSESPRKTQAVAEKLAQKVKNGGVVCLYGELGSGKTTFIQGLAKALKIKRPITSPTFLMVRNYGNFYHLDLYRVEKERDLETLGLDEIFESPTNIIAVEWAEKIKEFLPQKRFDIRFEIRDEQTRKISIQERS